jgi:hypothetical protein
VETENLKEVESEKWKAETWKLENPEPERLTRVVRPANGPVVG